MLARLAGCSALALRTGDWLVDLFYGGGVDVGFLSDVIMDVLLGDVLYVLVLVIVVLVLLGHVLGDVLVLLGHVAGDLLSDVLSYLLSDALMHDGRGCWVEMPIEHEAAESQGSAASEPQQRVDAFLLLLLCLELGFELSDFGG